MSHESYDFGCKNNTDVSAVLGTGLLIDISCKNSI